MISVGGGQRRALFAFITEAYILRVASTIGSYPCARRELGQTRFRRRWLLGQTAGIEQQELHDMTLKRKSLVGDQSW